MNRLVKVDRNCHTVQNVMSVDNHFLDKPKYYNNVFYHLGIKSF